jgi:hypothetical protein
MSPNKLWRSNSIFNLCYLGKRGIFCSFSVHRISLGVVGEYGDGGAFSPNSSFGAAEVRLVLATVVRREILRTRKVRIANLSVLQVPRMD